ncbi:hypothetical protein KVV02_000592 [Mortierella alpina]|uniref:GED domain-containing protein n=1 Tax=Mortierella alpina TaxID=64518 RepID=A0A9P8CUZ0_MORAP|nr:hypothetical protein KVV02_000592 [Mortierella alpina]
MKNSSFKDIDLSWDDARKREEEIFRSSPLWNDVPDTRKGRLRSSLADLLNGNYAVDYIKTYLSRQRSEDVEESGESDDDDCEPIILEEDGDHNFIRSSLYKLYQHYNTAMNKDKYLLPNDRISELVLLYKGNELSGFISFTTFTQIYTDTLLRWSSITKNHIANMHQFLHRAISTFISSTTDPGIRDALCLEFDRFYNSQVEQIDGAIENIFASESIPFTMNKYYYDNILNSRKTKAEQHIQEVVNKFQPSNNSNFSGYQVKDILQRSLTSYCNVQHLSNVDYNERLAIEDLQEQLISYCKVARKRIVDVILLQTIELHMIKQTDIYFEQLKSCDSSNRISRQLLDSPSKIKRRQELEDRVDVLRKSLKELWSSDTTRT